MSFLIQYQRVILWMVILLYFVGWLPFALGVIFDKKRWVFAALKLIVGAFLIHVVWIVIRWMEVGHGPYLNLYEVASSDSIVAVLIYLFAQWRYPKVRILGVFIIPTVFLLMGVGALSTKEPVELSPILDSSWLVVHVITAKLAFGSYLISAALAVSYLFKERGIKGGVFKWFPENPINEELNRKFITLGFLNHTVMLVSGSIWANVAFGSYWSWDPIETWSLISWIVYGIFYHLITIHGWRGKRMAWFTLVALGSIVFALFGVPFLFKGSHNLFL